MLSENTNKMTWVGVAIGIVAVLGLGANALFPSAFKELSPVIRSFIVPESGFGKNNPKQVDYSYNYKTQEATLVANHTNVDILFVPQNLTYNGTKFTVTKINDGAIQNQKFTQIQIPDTITYIGTAAFQNTKMEALTIPDNVTNIGKYAFHNSDISTLKFNTKLTHIGDGAFQGNNISVLQFPNSLESIGNSAFQENPKLKTIAFTENIKHLGDWSFAPNADGTGTRINNITKAPAIIAPNGANYNPNAFQQDVVWTNPN